MAAGIKVRHQLIPIPIEFFALSAGIPMHIGVHFLLSFLPALHELHGKNSPPQPVYKAYLHQKIPSVTIMPITAPFPDNQILHFSSFPARPPQLHAKEGHFL